MEISNRKLLTTAFLVGIILLMLQTSTPHTEESLLSDWGGPPPPWPVFIGLNILSDTFQKLSNALKPTPVRLFEMSLGYHMTTLLYICQKNKIPDFLGSGPKTITDITEYLGMVDEHRVERLMYALASHGVTKMHSKSGKIYFQNTDLSAIMRRDHPNSVAGWVGHNFEDLWDAWGKLPTQFGPGADDKKQKTAWDLANGDQHPQKKGGVWSLYKAHPEREEQFGRAMAAIDSLGSSAMIADGPFQKFDNFVDIGGSTGHFTIKLMESLLASSPKNWNSKAVVFDRDPVIEHVQQDDIADSISSHIQFEGGSFFEEETIPRPPGGNTVYFMRYILHDWNDNDCIKILTAVRHAMMDSSFDQDSSLLIGEVALSDRETGPAIPPMIHNIDMQMMTVFSTAVERTPSEWKELLTKTGFDLVAIHPTRSLLQWVEAKPVS